MNALWLKSCGLSHADICHYAGISSTTLTNYIKRYNDTSLDDLSEPAYHIPKSELEQHRETLQAYFEKHPPRTKKEAAHKIEELTGIVRSTQRVRVFLKGLGLSYRKVGMVPSKADPEVQEDFKKNAGAPDGRGEGWHEASVFCGCGTFCARAATGVLVVF